MTKNAARSISEEPEAVELDRHLSDFIGYAMKRAQSIVQADFARVLAEHECGSP
jgi:hypothetical protein